MLFVIKSLRALSLRTLSYSLILFLPPLSLSLCSNRELNLHAALFNFKRVSFSNEALEVNKPALLDSFDRSLVFANALFYRSIVLTWLPRPRMNNMTKNRTAQTLGIGIRTTASGYAIKARPAPLWITSSIGTPIWRARNPMMEKITNPAKIDVSRFVRVTKSASLEKI